MLGNGRLDDEALLTDARLGKKPADRLLRHYVTPGLVRERRKFDEILAVDLAHVVMLGEREIISSEVTSALLTELLALRNDGVADLDIQSARGSMLLQIESRLSERLGPDRGGALATARSRIDQGATFRRLYEGKGLLAVMDAVASLEEALLTLASRHLRTEMPGYTHLQPSQPWVFGHYLIGCADKLHCDFERLDAAYGLTMRSPLGTVGGSGTGWPIDRRRTAELLGFFDVIDNARLGRDIQYLGDIAAATALLLSDLNDLATDLQLWSSQEFALVELDAAYCGTSSIFPQKKNPVALEGVRTASAVSTQWFGAVLAMCRGLGSGDLAMRSIGFAEDMTATSAAMTDLMTGVVETLQVNAEAMAASAGDHWTMASSLADMLVRQAGLSYRVAHHAIGQLVRNALNAGLRPDRLDAQSLRALSGLGAAADPVTDDMVRRALDPARFAAGNISLGGTAPGELERLLSAARTAADVDQQVVAGHTARMRDAAAQLDAAVAALTGGETAALTQSPTL